MSTEITPRMRRSILIAALRDPKLWPADFGPWDFSSSRTCALELTRALGLTKSGGLHMVATALAIPGDAAGDLFTPLRFCPEFNRFDYPKHKITPAMVADRLESLHNAMGEK